MTSAKVNVRILFLLLLASQSILEQVKSKERGDSVEIVRAWLLNRLYEGQQQQQQHHQKQQGSEQEQEHHVAIAGLQHDVVRASSSNEQPADIDMLAGQQREESFSEQLGELGELLDERANQWGLDIFKVHLLSGEHSLPVIVFEIFRCWRFFQKFGIQPEPVLNFLFKLEAQYNQNKNSFHNSVHAADVVQSTNVLLSSISFELTFTDLEIMAAIVAAAVHELGHTGYTNQFLVDTGHPLAILYNDRSVTENRSLAEAFRLLLGKTGRQTGREDCNFLKGLNLGQKRIFRKLVITLVFALDPVRHQSLFESLKNLVLAGGSFFTKSSKYLENSAQDGNALRTKALEIIVHGADISQATKPKVLYDQWIARLKEEACRQDHQERALGIPISSVCVRLDSREMQLSYIDHIMLPWWKSWAEFMSNYEGRPMLMNLLALREYLAKSYVGLDVGSSGPQTSAGTP